METNIRHAAGVIGATLRRLRLERGLYQQVVAERAHLNRSYISKLEKGRRPNPSADTVARLAAALGITVGEFYAEAGMSAPESAPETTIPMRVPRSLVGTVQALIASYSASLQRRLAEDRADYQAMRREEEEGPPSPAPLS